VWFYLYFGWPLEPPLRALFKRPSKVLIKFFLGSPLRSSCLGPLLRTRSFFFGTQSFGGGEVGDGIEGW